MAKTRTEAAQEQAAERAKALETEQQARRDDSEAHRQALTALRDEWKERLASVENQRENAEKRAQEAEKSKTKAEVRSEALAARIDVLGANEGEQQKLFESGKKR